MTRLISTQHSYTRIEEMIKPYWFSIRETPDPLHRHKYGLPLVQFTSKRNLVSYLNMKIEQMERKRNEKTA